jgi:hypothetical protein
MVCEWDFGALLWRLTRESANRSQMDIKHKTCDIRTLKNIYFLTCPLPTLIRLFHRFTSVSTRSIEVIWLFFHPLPHLVRHHPWLSDVLERISRPSYEPLYETKTSHCKHETFLYEYPLHWVFCPEKTHNITLLFGSSLLNHGPHFDYWNQSLNMCVRFCYLDCHGDGLCCYLVKHIENQLHPLKLFYFHLWPIYWLSLVTEEEMRGSHVFNLTVASTHCRIFTMGTVDFLINK